MCLACNPAIVPAGLRVETQLLWRKSYYRYYEYCTESCLQLIVWYMDNVPLTLTIPANGTIILRHREAP